MSLEIRAEGVIRRHGVFGTKPSAEAFAETTRAWLDHRCEHLRVRPAAVTRDGDSFEVVAFVHPAGGHIVVRVDTHGRVTLESTTNPVGPGFHAFVCDTVDAVGAELKVKWSGVEDETGFFDHRDFARLRQVMTNWLRHLATFCVEQMSDGAPLALSMPIGPRPELQPGMVAMPMGPRPSGWLRSVAAKQSDGNEFFAWWDQGWGVPDRVRWLHAALWNVTSFEEPQNQEEANLQQLVLRHAAALVTDGADLGPMSADLADLSRAEGGTYECHFANHAGGGAIGYRRLPATHLISHGWSITLPGHFAVIVEDDTWIAYDNDRTVRFSSYKIRSDDTPERLLNSLSIPDGFEALPLETRNGAVHRVSFGRAKPEDDCDWVVRCEVVNLPNLGCLTVAVVDRYHSWGIEITGNLRFTRPA